MKNILIISFVLFPFFLQAQEYLSGVVNSYYSVVSVGGDNVTCAGIEDLSNLQRGDKVLLIQMKGAIMDTLEVNWFLNSSNRIIDDVGGAGNYEFLAVNSVNQGAGTVTFTANLKRTYNASEKVQLIKIVETDIAVVDGNLLAQKWDGNKGGVIALVVLRKLILEADIDASSSGFMGGEPDSYSIGCRPYNVSDTLYFKNTAINKSGEKGESLISVNFPYGKGGGSNLTGGGAGVGLFGGGAGGSSFGRGGDGGTQNNSCTSSFSQFGIGGSNIGNYGFYDLNVVTFGGGGGSSTQFGTYSTTSGGDGGGIIFILADTVVGNGHSLLANGESITVESSAGGAGGGGGGNVLLDIATYSTGFNVVARGGNGGDTDASCNGSGGGGSGGVLLFSGTTLPGIVNQNLTGGSAGISNCGSNGVTGQSGQTLSNLQLILNGFLFNAITGTDTICQGQVPDLILGSTPKGTGPFTYDWLQSTDNVNWDLITGSNLIDYQPGSLDETTYFTRVVTDLGDGNLKDTAFSIKIHVYDAVSNNDLNIRDTLCFGTIPGTLTAGTVSGGDYSNYYYTWQSSINQTTWVTRSSNEILNETNNLNQTTYYRRIVESAKVCVDISNIDTLTIIPLIGSNTFITSDTTICSGLNGGTIMANNPTGGDGVYRYKWICSLTNNNDYTTISGSLPSYSPGVLTTTTYYKRIVLSGEGDVCVDTTLVPRAIDVLVPIAQNVLSTAETKYCSSSTPSIINGDTPIGGDGSFAFSWIHSITSGWEVISSETGKDLQPPTLIDTTAYRRVVNSGPNNTCSDTSSWLSINILDPFTNTILSTGENICEGSTPEQLIGQIPLGGAGVGTYSYLWQHDPGISNVWSDAPESESVNTNLSYSPPALTQSSRYRRIVYSDICSDVSDPVEIIVYGAITQNNISGPSEQFTCYNNPAELAGSNPTGGQAGVYSFIWQVSPDNVAWDTAQGEFSLRSHTSINLLSPIYFRRIVLSGETAQCKDTSASVHVLLNSLPTGDITSFIDTLCSGDDITIAYSVAGNGPWIISLGETQVLNSNSPVSEDTGELKFPIYESTEIVVLGIEDENGCFADTSLNSGKVNAVVYEVPIAEAGEDVEVCGLVAQINAKPSVGNGVWTINGTGNIGDLNAPDTYFEVDNYGAYQLTWTETNWDECIDNDQLNVVFYEQPTDVEAGENIELLYEFITNLNATEPIIGEGRWQFISGQGDFSDSTQPGTLLEMPKVGVYKLQWTVTNGACLPISDSVSININDIVLYKGFSPNEDGINDIYKVDLTEGSEATLIIFDRNGNVVNEIKDISLLLWDGKSSNGDILPEDTYFYILKEKDQKERQGYIELRR